MELAGGVIEAAQGRRARAPRAHRCTGRSHDPVRAFCDFFWAVAKFTFVYVRVYYVIFPFFCTSKASSRKSYVQEGRQHGRGSPQR